jgi:hypothetical protein
MLARVRREIIGGDDRNDFMTLITPGPGCGLRTGAQKTEYKGGLEYEFRSVQLRSGPPDCCFSLLLGLRANGWGGFEWRNFLMLTRPLECTLLTVSNPAKERGSSG